VFVVYAKPFIIGGGIFLPIGLFFVVIGLYQGSLEMLAVGTPYYTGQFNQAFIPGLVLFGAISAAAGWCFGYGLIHRKES
jgi:hypothetical protein